MWQILVPTLIGYSSVSLWIDRVIGIFCIVFIIGVLSFHIYTEKHTELTGVTQRRNRNNRHLVRLVRGSVYSVIISTLIGNILWIHVIFNPFHMECSLIWIIALIGYCINRVFLFEFAVIRLKVVFNSSAHAYKDRFLKWMAFGSFIDVVISFWLSWYTLDIDQHDVGNGEYQCFQRVYLIPIFAVGIVDMVWMILLYWLFYKQMKKLFLMLKSLSIPNGAMSGSGEGTEIPQITYVTRKLAVLLASSIISTWSLIFFLLFSSIALSALTFDMAFNCVCMVLCDKRYDNIYLFFCKCVAKKEILLFGDDGGNDKTASATKNSSGNTKTINSNSDGRNVTASETINNNTPIGTNTVPTNTENYGQIQLVNDTYT